MFIARFFLGFGIGPKSATTPIFAAECSPPKLRGALTMQWQMWTAFGIMVGYVADLAFYFVSMPTGRIHEMKGKTKRGSIYPTFKLSSTGLPWCLCQSFILRTNGNHRSPTMESRLV